MNTNNTKAIALCALMTALSTVIMLLGGIIPVMTYSSPILASLFLIPITCNYGKKWSFLTYIVTAFLSLLLSLDKESAFFWVFFGWYPIWKPMLDQKIRNKILTFLFKLLLFSISTFLMYFITCTLLGIEEIIESLSSTAFLNIIFYTLVVTVMMIYDFVLTKIQYIFPNFLGRVTTFFANERRHRP